MNLLFLEIWPLFCVFIYRSKLSYEDGSRNAATKIISPRTSEVSLRSRAGPVRGSGGLLRVPTSHQCDFKFWKKKMVPTNCGRHLFTGQQQFIWATSKVWASRKQNLDFDHMCRTDFRLFRAVFCTVKYRHKVEECASVFCGLLHFQ